jgi:thiamine-phosphate pyrophosphorylase
LASNLTLLLSSDERTLVEKIVHLHQTLKIEQRDSYQDFVLTSKDTIYRCVKVACFELGFIQQDAELIAWAWSKQSSASAFDPEHWPSNLQDFDSYPTNLPSFASCPLELGLYVVAPSAQWVAKLAQAGVKTIQLRFKSESKELIEQEVQAAVQSVQGYPCHLFINDHWQAAIDFKAYGIHLGQEDLSSADFAAIQAAGLRLGISTHGYAEMLRAIAYQPSYIALGAIFPTTLKAMETAPQGIGRLRQYARLLKGFSLVGIGGVDASNIRQVIDSQVGSVAVVRAVIQAQDYQSAIANLQSYFVSN